MKIKFKIDVTTPAAQVGTKGEIKDVDDRAANILIDGGYAVMVATIKIGKKKTRNRKNED